MSTAAQASFGAENQRSVIKFFFLKGYNALQIRRELVPVLGKYAYSETNVRYWCRLFKEEKWDVGEHRGGDHTPGSPRKERVAILKKSFEQSRAWTLRSLSAKYGIAHVSFYRIVTGDLKMTKKNKKWVPHELTPGQLETRVVYSRFNLVTYSQQKSRLEHTVTIDETWMSLHRPPEKDQAREWLKEGEEPTSVAGFDRYGPKVMAIVAMDINGICYSELLAQKETVTAARYLAFLKKLMAKWRGKRKHRVWLLDDNAKPHRHATIEEWIEENRIGRWFQPPYSPDLSPCDYGCFRALKRAIGGVSYPSVTSLKKAIDKEVTDGNAHGRYATVRSLPERWQRCIKNKGAYL